MEEYVFAESGEDIAPKISDALRKKGVVRLAKGNYTLRSTLFLPSRSRLVLDEGATINCAANCFNRDDVTAIVSNADQSGDEDITVEGGVWNAAGALNPRPDWRNGPGRGVTFSFYNVRGLTLKNVNIVDSATYNVRLGRVRDFLIEDITFVGYGRSICQDGIHTGGGCENGTIRNVRAEGGATDDDLIAFNSDDAFSYKHNEGMEALPIRNILVDGVYAENCWTALRILSIDTLVENLTLRNFICGVRETGINLDATRYAGDKIFSDEDYPHGVGNIRNVTAENFTLWRTEKDKPLLVIESNAYGFAVKNFRRDRNRESEEFTSPTAVFDHLKEGSVLVAEEGKTVINKEKHELNGDEFSFVLN